MKNVLKLVVTLFGAALVAAACAKGATDGEGDQSGMGGAASAGTGGSTAAMNSAASATNSSGNGSASGAGGNGIGSGASSGSGVASSSSGNPSGGAACVPGGAISAPGSTGPCNANQNCPTTVFTAVVAGAPGPIADVDVSIDAIAASTDQNILWLRSPQGTLVTLFNHRGNFLTDDFVGTMFDDEAAVAVSMAPGPFHGCYQPEQPLAAFKGQPANGTWKLEVQTCLYQTTVTGWTLHLDF